jgi:aminoglycoside phosphotransferase (APT) family kinase protein
MRPSAQFPIDERLVRELIEEQHPDLAGLPLTDVGEGWDNHLFRLGRDLCVRLPRHTAASVLIEQEQRWLPVVAPRLPLPVPVPLRVGRPGCGFPWTWTIASWLPGETALRTPPRDLKTTAETLGRFLRALHQPAPDDAPRNIVRGVPLAERDDLVREQARRLRREVDQAKVLALWDRALQVAEWSGPPLWIHGDLHPGNLLVSKGRLSAVIDFGDLTAGDPATDLSVVWMLLPASLHLTFLSAARGDDDPRDEATIIRARGWALALGLAFMTNAEDWPELAALGRQTVAAVLTGDQE